jgi:prepilin-type processing-associated H-X9-DG protein
MVAGSDVAWVYTNISLGGTPLLQYTGMTRHQGGMNIGLCDGHAHFYPPSQIPGLNSGTGNMGIWFDYTQ